ncbi:probable very-long-chain enoyl-CoA reductase art-1 [Trichonephila clavata]|uniref:very-long-chain enoyl-CoA reductase n=1 Tax=Trichonephila clavata TaxID=2740835 RepID=A0A8X6G1J9_TRICU|nr:probable very-long-chain enoyl-CoA reductase art-1 [Trichonephila clavata]
MDVEILQGNNSKPVAQLTNLSGDTTIYDIKKEIHKIKRTLHPNRQALRLDARGKFLSDSLSLHSVEFKSQNKQLYLKDLGPQIGWKTVFLLEYAGPLALYVATYLRPPFIYGADATKPMHPVINIAVACWVFHYSKRLLETLYVHRFSHATMPLRNLFKNCSYYWAFGFFIGYYANHPLYTAPTCQMQIYGSLAAFILAELGNLSIHLALRNLRPEGSNERKIPVPTGNPFTWLFNLVSCPNYTYEVMAWISFSVMTNCLPAGLFTLAGFYQMAVWAQGKHRNYKKEFSNYPKGRKAIIPFIL